MENAESLDNFQSSVIGYKFEKEEILRTALIHPSLNNQIEFSDKVKEHVRLQFLGSSVFRMLVSELVFNAYPDKSEGFLSMLANKMYSKQVSADVAKKLDLCGYIKMDQSCSGVCNDSCLSNGLSAVVAALYIDGGLDRAREFVTNHWKDHVRFWNPAKGPKPAPPEEDPKSKLIRWATQHNPFLPKFTVVEQTGSSQDPTFTVSATYRPYGTVQGKGNTKRMAERNAAEKLLRKIEKKNETVPTNPQSA